jgi:adenosine deaminase
LTKATILEAADDGVQYLELRTKLVENPESGITKASGMQAILSVLNEVSAAGCWNSTGMSVTVKLVLTIDRSDTLELVSETIDFAINERRRDRTIVGIDLGCSRPSAGCTSFASLKPVLERARDSGLKVTLHCSEIFTYGSSDEVSEMIDFGADRMANCFFVNSDFEEKIIKSGIPVEVCLTSNVKTKAVKSYQDLKKHVIKNGESLVLCTDHAGVFGTSLSMEFAIASRTYSISKEDLCILALSSIDAAFCSDMEKEALRARLRYVLEKVGFGYLIPVPRHELDDRLDLSPSRSAETSQAFAQVKR